MGKAKRHRLSKKQLDTTNASNKVISPLFEKLTSNSVDAFQRVAAVNAVAELVNTGNLPILSEHGILDKLLPLLSDSSIPVKLATTGTLYNIVLMDAKSVSYLIEIDILTPLFSNISNCSAESQTDAGWLAKNDSVSFLTQSLALLDYLLEISDHVLTKIYDVNGFIDILIHLLFYSTSPQSPISLQVEAVKILLTLSEDGQQDKQSIISSIASPHFFASLSSNPALLQQNWSFENRNIEFSAYAFSLLLSLADSTDAFNGLCSIINEIKPHTLLTSIPDFIKKHADASMKSNQQEHKQNEDADYSALARSMILSTSFQVVFTHFKHCCDAVLASLEALANFSCTGQSISVISTIPRVLELFTISIPEISCLSDAFSCFELEPPLELLENALNSIFLIRTRALQLLTNIILNHNSSTDLHSLAFYLSNFIIESCRSPLDSPTFIAMLSACFNLFTCIFGGINSSDIDIMQLQEALCIAIHIACNDKFDENYLELLRSSLSFLAAIHTPNQIFHLISSHIRNCIIFALSSNSQIHDEALLSVCNACFDIYSADDAQTNNQVREIALLQLFEQGIFERFSSLIDKNIDIDDEFRAVLVETYENLQSFIEYKLSNM